MSTTALLTEITALPPELRQEVEDFVAFLRTKSQRTSAIKEREFGYAKGKVRLAKDFDEPLDEFNEYM
ncbi:MULTISPECIES: DUF2281 domain-containing protein [unclassified Spirosoma]|uniref:type II toxin-antitoxin system VapB family antitoxin n=1 Tax=unclassified Spirosoma TaxID=2621999 RepID=UPI00095CC52F|nr:MULTISPECIES: DUF2281 domain-containing protein [unclassified Spirosoma]MBN8822603.1 DUF2281 domain-containing protein [Spirosoma sp.]OJW74096.1 MAG: hypothetical protein BGO59_13285 [Spirosoma sp. 48-14]